MTSTFSSHPSVTTLHAAGAARRRSCCPGAGWIDAKTDRTAAIPVDSPIKAHFATFVDKNGNFTARSRTSRSAPGSWPRPRSRRTRACSCIADSDWFGDEAIKVAGQQLLALDVIHWLMGDEAFSGQTSTEADVTITHTRKQDVAWFYWTIFLAPALVHRRGRRRHAQDPPQAPRGKGRGDRGRTAVAAAAHDRRRRRCVMTGRALAVQGGLAVVGLLAAYATWQREPEQAPGAVTVIDASKSDVTLVRYEDERRPSISTRGKTATRTASGCTWSPGRSPRRSRTPRDPKAAPSRQRRRRRPRPRAICRAPTTRSKLLEQFAPLVSPRAFGVLDAAKLKELGLGRPKRKLDVTVKGAVRQLRDRTAGDADRRASPSCATRATGAST